MKPYLDLLRHVIHNGTLAPTRATLASTGEHVNALGVFGTQTRYDLSSGFPLVTTKAAPFRQVVAELLWFLSGNTNVKALQSQGVHIWDQWADREGNLGPTYGHQWRRGKVDQVRWLAHHIEAVRDDPFHPAARRLILSAWNVAELPAMRLPPCHVLAQFHVRDGHLSCQFYQRSADLFLGVPWNIASYALLTGMLAHVTGLKVGELVHTIGDAHIYENHMDQVREQLGREPLPPPWVMLNDKVKDIDEFKATDIALIDYQHHPKLSGEVAV